MSAHERQPIREVKTRASEVTEDEKRSERSESAAPGRRGQEHTPSLSLGVDTLRRVKESRGPPRVAPRYGEQHTSGCSPPGTMAPNFQLLPSGHNKHQHQRQRQRHMHTWSPPATTSAGPPQGSGTGKASWCSLSATVGGSHNARQPVRRFGSSASREIGGRTGSRLAGMSCPRPGGAPRLPAGNLTRVPDTQQLQHLPREGRYGVHTAAASAQ